MSEYDAFGRKKGEDPLAGLGGHMPPRPAPPPDAPVPPPYAPQSSPIAVPGRPQRRRSAAPMIIALVVLGAVGAGAISLFAAVDSTIDGFDPGAVATAEPPAQATAMAPSAAAAPKGLERGSLIRRDELTKALQTIRAAELGGIVSLRVDPEDVSAQIKTRDGYLRHVMVSKDGLTKGSPSGPGFDHIETFASREVDPAAPQRLLRAAARRLERSPNEVDYLVLMNIGGPLWGVFFKDGAHFQGDAAGRLTRRVS